MERRCKFWLPKKNRFCANAPLKESLFCGNHNPRPVEQRIPCPLDPSHTVLQENLEAHLKRCPLLKQVQSLKLQPFYKRGINAGRDEEDKEDEEAEESTSKEFDNLLSSNKLLFGLSDNTTSNMKRNAVYSMSTPAFTVLIRKIKSIHGLMCSDIRDSCKMPEACGIWIKKEIDRKLPFQEKHVLQQASILGNMAEFGLLESPAAEVVVPEPREHLSCDRSSSRKNNEVPAVVEFGAGRAYLTQMLADCYGIEKVVLVERKSYKLKADRSLRQKESLSLERLRIDIEDLDLNAVESLKGIPYLAIGKHLCGPATDKRYLSNLGITKEEFHAITWFTSWAVDADHGSDLSDAVDRGLHLCSIEEDCSVDAYSGVEEIVRKMEALERAALGLMCKEIIDMGRKIWMKEKGLETRHVKYVPSTISPENHLLVAKCSNHL